MEDGKEIGGELYNYMIHYNHYKDLWYAIPRESYLEYWNGNYKNCLSSDNIEGLLSEIYFIEIEK